MKRRIFSKKIITGIFATAMATKAFAKRPVHKNYPETDARDPKLSDPKSFTIAVFGDPQNYTKHSRNHGALELQTAWFVNNKKDLNLKAVLTTGDMVEYNSDETKRPPWTTDSVNQTSTQMWTAYSRAMERLDGYLPYINCTGNHDYGFHNSETRETQFNKYFSVDRNPANKKVLVDMCENAFGEKTLENACFEITGEGWGKVLIFALEYLPRDSVLNWVRKICTSPKYSKYTAILLTHTYVAKTDLVDREPFKVRMESNYNGGKQIWEKLVKSAPNIRIVLCGHGFSGKDAPISKSCATVKMKNDNGKTVWGIRYNTQTVGGGWPYGNGGDGFVRFMEFLPDGKTIKNYTYSPVMAYSLKTESMAWSVSENTEFDIVLD